MPAAELPGPPAVTSVRSTCATSVRIRDPGELVATVPVLLGFHPVESLVLVATGGPSGRRTGLTLRVDLPPPDDGGAAHAVADAAVRGLMLDAPVGAAVIVVGRGSATGPVTRAVVDGVLAGFRHRHVQVHTVVWAESTTAGARWGCCGPCACRGALPDPAATVAAAASVLEGRVVRADRGDLEQLVVPADPERIRRREALLVAAHDRAAELGWESPFGESASGDPAPGVALVDAALGDLAEGRLVLDDDRAVALAVALGDPLVRDAAILRSSGPLAAVAESLWAALVREVPDPEAAEAATLLAISALLRGDGALANIALERAERSWPGHRLAGMLGRAVTTGIRPVDLRACLLRAVDDGAVGPP